MHEGFINTHVYMRKHRPFNLSEAEMLAVLVMINRFSVHHYVMAILNPLMGQMPVHIIAISQNKKMIVHDPQDDY